MLGAVVGDIVGSIYEFENTKSTESELFTPWSSFADDFVMTLAVAKWLVGDYFGHVDLDYVYFERD